MFRHKSVSPGALGRCPCDQYLLDVPFPALACLHWLPRFIHNRRSHAQGNSFDSPNTPASTYYICCNNMIHVSYSILLLCPSFRHHIPTLARRCALQPSTSINFTFVLIVSSVYAYSMPPAHHDSIPSCRYASSSKRGFGRPCNAHHNATNQWWHFARLSFMSAGTRLRMLATYVVMFYQARRIHAKVFRLL